MDKRKDNSNYKERGKLRHKGEDAALRAYLLGEIEEKYQSVFKFCKERVFEYKDVTKFLTGKRSWSLSKTLALLAELGYETLGLSKEPLDSRDKKYVDFAVEQVAEAETQDGNGEKRKEVNVKNNV